MDPVSTRELILGVIAAVWTVALGVMTFRRQSRENEANRTDKERSDTIVRWREIYEQKCEDHDRMKRDCDDMAGRMTMKIDELKRTLTEEQITCGGLRSELRQARRDLRRAQRDSDGEDDGEDDNGQRSPVPGRIPQ